MEVKSTTTNRVQSLILIAAITGWLLAIILGVTLIAALARDPSSVVDVSPGPPDGHRTVGLQDGAYILTLRNASSEAVTAIDIEYRGWHRTLSGG